MLQKPSVTMGFLDLSPSSILYHYTSFESAVKIIASNSLRFGDLKSFNDIAENSKRIIASGELTLIVEKILDNYHSISFTLDSTNQDKRGFALDTQWGYYAKSGKGACLVFKKDNLRKCYKAQFGKDAIRFCKIDYKAVSSSISWFDYSDLNETKTRFNKTRIKDLFFEKKKIWQHEKEYRMLVYSEEKNSYLHFDDNTLLSIITYNVAKQDGIPNTTEYHAFKEMSKDIPVLRLSDSINSMTLYDEDDVAVWSNSFYNVNPGQLSIIQDWQPL